MFNRNNDRESVNKSISQSDSAFKSNKPIKITLKNQKNALQT